METLNFNLGWYFITEENFMLWFKAQLPSPPHQLVPLLPTEAMTQRWAPTIKNFTQLYW